MKVEEVIGFMCGLVTGVVVMLVLISGTTVPKTQYRALVDQICTSPSRSRSLNFWLEHKAFMPQEQFLQCVEGK